MPDGWGAIVDGQTSNELGYNLFTHNRDDHAKNFSYIMNEKVWKISPVYDITFSSGIEGGHSMMYLGEGKNPSQKHLLELGQKHGVKNSVNIIFEVKKAVWKWGEFAELAGISTKTTKMIANSLAYLATE